MPHVEQIENLGRILADFDRRLRTQETAARAANTSVTDEAGHELLRISRQGVTLFDPAGNVVATLSADGVSTFDPGDGLPRQVAGVFGDGVSTFTGWVLYDGDGKSVLMTRNDKPGLIKPDIPAPFRDTSSRVLVTSGTFVETHRFDPRRLYHDTLQLDIFASCTGVTTAGELRIREINSGRTTDAITIPAGSTGGHALFDWLHGAQVGDDPGEGIYFSVEARRTAGTLEVAVSIPDAVMTSSALVSAADTAGHARWV